MITCPNCNRSNEDEYKYCLGCGSPLPRPQAAPAPPPEPETISCSQCGTQVPPNFKFCGACGGSVRGASTATSPGSGRPAESTEKVADLVIIRPDGSEGARIPVPSGELRLGRESPYEVLSDDPFLSPIHAVIHASSQGFRLVDEDSLNGVFLRVHDEVELHDDDYIRVGQELLHFRLLDNLDAVGGAPPADNTMTQGSVDSGAWGRLSLVGGPGLESRAFVLDGEDISIGREVGDIIFGDDGFVSGRHAQVARSGDRYILRDLGSSNGTYVRIRGETRVGAGDLILMGQQLFRLVAS